jgi:phosphoribosyl-dephospho-CoA transferase
MVFPGHPTMPITLKLLWLLGVLLSKAVRWNLPTENTSDTAEPAPLATDGRNLFSKVKTLFTGASGKEPQYVEEKFKSEKTPILLDDEVVHFAWKAVRDYTILTSRRVLIVNVEGVGSTINYQSFKYSKMISFSVNTKGTIDTNSEIRMWFKTGTLEVKLRSKHANLLQVQEFLSEMMFTKRDIWSAPINIEANSAKDASGIEGAYEEASDTDFSVKGLVQRALGMVWKDPKFVEERLKSEEEPIILDDETVECAYYGVRDTLAFTDRRVVLRDRKGLTGLRVVHTSFPYDQIISFSVRSHGVVDMDAEVILFTENARFVQSLSRKADLFVLQKTLAARMLGPRAEVKDKRVAVERTNKSKRRAHTGRGKPKKLRAANSQPPVSASLLESDPDAKVVGKGSPLAFWKATSVDAQNLTIALTSGPTRVLLPDEHVVRAVKSVRDYFVVTSRRILAIDMQGLTGKAIEYKSIHPDFVSVFTVVTPGKVDLDGELYLVCTDGSRHIEKLRKDEDIMSFQRDLAALILRGQPPFTRDDELTPRSTLDGLFGGYQQNIGNLDEELRQKPSNILFPDERVHASIEAARGLVVLTSLRVIHIAPVDAVGPISKVMHMSIPYHSIRGFTATCYSKRSDGATRISLHTAETVHSFAFDFGAVDECLTLQKMLAARVLRNDTPHASAVIAVQQHFKTPRAGWLNAAFGGFVTNPGHLDVELHEKPFDVLLHDEKVAVAYRLRSQILRGLELYTQTTLFVLTPLRILCVQKSGEGQVQYISVPYEYVDTFSVSPGYKGITREIMDINQTVMEKNAQFTVRSSSAMGDLVSLELRPGQQILTLHRMLSAAVV